MYASIFKFAAVWVVRGWLMAVSCGVVAEQAIGSVTTPAQKGVGVFPITPPPAVRTQVLALLEQSLPRDIAAAKHLKRYLDEILPGLAISRQRANVLPVTDPLFLKQRKWFYIGLKKAKPPE